MKSENRMLSKSIKILYPMIHYPPVIGGIEQWAENIAQRAGDDIEVTVICGKVSGAPSQETKGNIKIIRTSLYPLSDLSHSSWIYIFTALPFVFFKSLIFARQNKIDLIHCHGFLSGFIGFVISLFTAVDFIGTEQSVGWAGSRTSFLRRVAYSKAKICIASSKAVEGEYKKIGISNTVVLPNGVDLSKFNTGENKKNSGFEILSVGRLEKVKGHEDLIYAFSNIKKKMPDACLTIVGNG